jgi:hypothetical protein
MRIPVPAHVWHCEQCGSTDPEDVGDREDGRYYSGCCNEKIVDGCGDGCDH